MLFTLALDVKFNTYNTIVEYIHMEPIRLNAFEIDQTLCKISLMLLQLLNYTHVHIYI